MTAPASIVRRIGMGLVAACATLLTASCAAGQFAASANETPAIDGVNGSTGSISLRAVAIVTPRFACYLPGSDVALTMIIVNTGHNPDSLTGVSSPMFSSSALLTNAADASQYVDTEKGAGSCAPASTSASSASPGASSAPPTSAAPSTPASGLPSGAPSLDVPANLAVQVNVAGTGADNSSQPVVVLRGLTGQPLWPAAQVPVTFSFANAGQVTLSVPVQLSIAPNNATVPIPSGAPSQ